MPRTLDVYLHRHLIGKLVQNDHGHMVFDYVGSWLTNPTAGDFLPGFCRMKANGRSLLAISGSALAMISPCWNGWAVSALVP